MGLNMGRFWRIGWGMKDWHYDLPEALIAHTPAEPRDSARLLRWPGLDETPFAALDSFLAAGDVVVINTSRVIPARIFGVRPARGGREAGADVRVEFLLHHPMQGDMARWEAFARPQRRLKVGDVVVLEGGARVTVAALGEKAEIVFELPAVQVGDYLEAHGHTPLPPYIKADDSPATRARYQTVYADGRAKGSVAAPTAGLHFTPALMERLRAKGVIFAPVTLHVGAGTFQNPTPEQMAAGVLHAEWAQLGGETAAVIGQALGAGKRVVAVGTTALRTLETWGRMGMPAEGFADDTTLFIQPGFEFRVATHLITNFHLPGSSLLMLVGAFIGEAELAAVYDHAVAQRFRFYSFGDTSFLTRKGYHDGVAI